MYIREILGLVILKIHKNLFLNVSEYLTQMDATETGIVREPKK